MERIYNKLVRDNIPEKIKGNGEMPIIRTLSFDEYKIELEKKLYEEYLEVIDAKGEDRLEELADMLEVIKALAITDGYSFEDIINSAKEKAHKRGAFKEKIFLEKVVVND